MINDTSETRLILTQLVTQSLQNSALVISYIVFLFLISWKMTLMALVIRARCSGLALTPILRSCAREIVRRGNQHGEMTSVCRRRSAAFVS